MYLPCLLIFQDDTNDVLRYSRGLLAAVKMPLDKQEWETMVVIAVGSASHVFTGGVLATSQDYFLSEVIDGRFGIDWSRHVWLGCGT